MFYDIDHDLHHRIQKFLDRKMTEHPELRFDGRVISKWRPAPRLPHGQRMYEP
jgi:hypothetical protein